MPIDTGASVGKKYRAYLAYPAGMPPPDIAVPKTITAAGYGVRLDRWQNDYTNRQVIVEYTLLSPALKAGNEMPGTSVQLSGADRTLAPVAVGAGAIILAALAVIGVAFIYLTVSKVEEIVDSPTGGALSIGVVLIGGFIAYQLLKGR